MTRDGIPSVTISSDDKILQSRFMEKLLDHEPEDRLNKFVVKISLRSYKICSDI